MAEIEFIEVKAEFFETAKGWAFFPFQAGVVPFEEVDGASFHVVKTNPGEIRGNHRHPGVEEWLHVFGGKAIFHWRAPDGAVKRRPIENEHTIIRVPPDVGHAVLNNGRRPVYLTAFRTKAAAPGPRAEPDEVL